MKDEAIGLMAPSSLNEQEAFNTMKPDLEALLNGYEMLLTKCMGLEMLCEIALKQEAEEQQKK